MTYVNHHPKHHRLRFVLALVMTLALFGLSVVATNDTSTALPAGTKAIDQHAGASFAWLKPYLDAHNIDMKDVVATLSVWHPMNADVSAESLSDRRDSEHQGQDETMRCVQPIDVDKLQSGDKGYEIKMIYRVKQKVKDDPEAEGRMIDQGLILKLEIIATMNKQGDKVGIQSLDIKPSGPLKDWYSAQRGFSINVNKANHSVVLDHVEKTMFVPAFKGFAGPYDSVQWTFSVGGDDLQYRYQGRVYTATAQFDGADMTFELT